MAGKSLRVSLSVLWPGTCSENFHETNKNSDYISETFECSVDILVMGSSLEEIMMSRDTLIFVLQNLGFVINFQKSILNPSHQIQFLGVEIDSLSMIVSLPIQKEQIISQCQDLLNQSDVSLRQMTQLIGRLSSTAIAALPAPLQYRSLQRQQILELAEKKSYSAGVVLSKEVREEIQW